MKAIDISAVTTGPANLSQEQEYVTKYGGLIGDRHRALWVLALLDCERRELYLCAKGAIDRDSIVDEIVKRSPALTLIPTPSCEELKLTGSSEVVTFSSNEYNVMKYTIVEKASRFSAFFDVGNAYSFEIEVDLESCVPEPSDINDDTNFVKNSDFLSPDLDLPPDNLTEGSEKPKHWEIKGYTNVGYMTSKSVNLSPYMTAPVLLLAYHARDGVAWAEQVIDVSKLRYKSDLKRLVLGAKVYVWREGDTSDKSETPYMQLTFFNEHDSKDNYSIKVPFSWAYAEAKERRSESNLIVWSIDKSILDGIANGSIIKARLTLSPGYAPGFYTSFDDIELRFLSAGSK